MLLFIHCQLREVLGTGRHAILYSSQDRRPSSKLLRKPTFRQHRRHLRRDGAFSSPDTSLLDATDCWHRQASCHPKCPAPGCPASPPLQVFTLQLSRAVPQVLQGHSTGKQQLARPRGFSVHVGEVGLDATDSSPPVSKPVRAAACSNGRRSILRDPRPSWRSSSTLPSPQSPLRQRSRNCNRAVAAVPAAPQKSTFS